MSALDRSKRKVMSGQENKSYANEDGDNWGIAVQNGHTEYPQQQGNGSSFGARNTMEVVDKGDVPSRRRDPVSRCYASYVRGLSKITYVVDKGFEVLARSLITHPFIWLAACFLLIGGCCVGYVRFSSEGRTEKLYVPQGSQAEKDQDRVGVYFNTLASTRLEEFGFFRKSGGNFMTKECVQEALDLVAAVMKIPKFEEMCIKKAAYISSYPHYNSNTNCSMLNPFEIITNASSALLDLNANLLNTQTLMSNGKLPVHNEGDMIAKVSRNGSSIVMVEVVRVQFYLQNKDKPTEALDWEKTFIDLMNEKEKSLKCASVLYSAQRSLDDAISASAGGDIVFISIAFTIMITFANVMLGKFNNPIRGHSLLAISGVLSTGLGIGAGFGLSLATGTPFVSIVGILPFLVLSIGIDDMFIIVDEFDKQLQESDAVERVPKAMRKIGATITMTTLTDITAFAVSVSTDFPAIRYFCTFAAITFTVEFVLQVTLFVVFLCFDARRIKAGRRECLPCCKGPDDSCCLKSLGDDNLSNVVARKYAELLMKWPSKVAALLLGAGLLAFGIYGCLNVSQEFSRTSLVKDGSYLLTYLDKIENDFDTGLPVDVYKLGVADYTNQALRKEISDVRQAAISTNLYKNEYISWLEKYEEWSRANGVDISGANFTRNLQKFLVQPMNSRFFLDVKFNAKGEIEASRTRVFMKPTKKSTIQKNAMKSLREEFKKRGLSLIPYSDNFIYFEQFAAVVGEVTRNIIVAALAVVVITLPFCVNPVMVLLLLFGFASLITNLIGLMYFWDVSLNSISMINLVMSIGFAIDYSAHVAHAFMTSKKEKGNERVIDAISNIGASVFMGGASTFLGMLVTAFAASEIFRIFFRMMVGIVVFGLFNGLVLLPVMFSLFAFLIGGISHD